MRSVLVLVIAVFVAAAFCGPLVLPGFRIPTDVLFGGLAGISLGILALSGVSRRRKKMEADQERATRESEIYGKKPTSAEVASRYVH